MSLVQLTDMRNESLPSSDRRYLLHETTRIPGLDPDFKTVFNAHQLL